MTICREVLSDCGKPVPNRRPLPPPPDQPVRAERFRAALQTRVLGLAGLEAGPNARALLLDRGQAVLQAGGTEQVLVAPVVGWFPWREDMRLYLGAGAQGTHLLLTAAALDRALRHRPEAAHLRFLADRVAVLRLDPGAPGAAALAACFDGLLAETLTPGPMASGVVGSLLHVLLVHLYRGQGGTAEAPGDPGGSAELAARFVALVEENFRAHWTVARYAAALGITRDRLHDLSRAAHGRSPGALIRARLTLEARQFLEHSPLSLGQIADALGFSGAAQFNRFFRAQAGQPPGRFRADLRRPGPERPPASAPYAWP